jgi:hypothetical protein
MPTGKYFVYFGETYCIIFRVYQSIWEAVLSSETSENYATVDNPRGLESSTPP